ncbi:MAG: zinc transporter ZupT [Bacilli bacterium]|nr:zinc transporter ZupT [Bacilli bacterium]
MDLQALYALLLSVIAGMATLIGGLIVIFTKSDNKKFISASLGFASGVMISVSMMELYSTSASYISIDTNDFYGTILSTLFVGIGMFITFIINHFVQDENKSLDNLNHSPKNKLFSVGFVSMLAIAIHNFPEGIATFMSSYGNIALGLSITLAIAFHNIPEGITVALPIYLSTNNKKKALLYTFLSGITEPLGALLAYFVLRFFLTNFIMGSIFGIVAGIMIYIAVDDLIPSSRNYGYDKIALLFTLIGICLMSLTQIF